MGCSYETAKQSSGINATFDTSCHTTIINPTSRTRNFYAKGAKPQINNNNCTATNKNITQDKTNDNCQQQLKPAKAKKTTIATANYSIISSSNNDDPSHTRDDYKRKSNFYSLEAKEHINKNSFCPSSPKARDNFPAKQEDELLQESCINCYPLACHNRICCRQQNSVAAEIAAHARHCTVDHPNYFKADCCRNNNNNNCNSKSNNCSCGNCCPCLVSSFFCHKHRNTLRNERPGDTKAYRESAVETASHVLGPILNTCSAGGHCLQRTVAQASAALTSNAVDLKNSLVDVMGNCATIVESLMRTNTQCAGHCDSYNKNNNNNKSEPYRGYCQRKHTLKPDFIPYTSTNSSCSLHDAISSKHPHSHQHPHQYHRQQRHNKNNTNNTNTTNTNNNNDNSSNSCSNCHAGTTTTTTTQTQTAAFNYIGHNYYHFLRNSINFYTAYTASVILVLCYLTTTTSAATTKSDSTSIDKHPIKGIDWSKFDESSSDKEILDLLLEQKRYDKRLLPPVHDEDFCCGLSSPDMATEQNSRRPHKRGTLNVNVTVLLLSLASPDESSLKYEVEFLLNQHWVDPRLQYGNKSHYDFLNALHHHDSIWTPDTYFSMHGDFKDPIIPMHFALRIYRNGTITYSMRHANVHQPLQLKGRSTVPGQVDDTNLQLFVLLGTVAFIGILSSSRRHLILSCQGSLHIFPFDDPKCSFSMESISYEEPQIRYVWQNGDVTLAKSPSLTSLNAYLIKNHTTACEQQSWRGNYSCLRVDLIFTRDRAFYFTTVFIPGIILVTSSFITFWLEWNAVPARSMIGNYSCLQVDLTFTRDRAYYFTTVFIPGIILVTSSFITFWLEWNAVPARVMIGVTTMLNFFTTSNGFRSTLPVVSNLTAMNVWDGVCMCFIYASLLEFVCVNYMGRKRPQHNVVYRPGENPVTQRLPAVLSRIGVILASPLEIIEREFNAAISSEKAAGGVSSAGTSMGVTPRPGSPAAEPVDAHLNYHRQHSGGIISSAVQNLRARSMKRRNVKREPEMPADQGIAVYEHIYAEPGGVTTFSAIPSVKTTAVTIETDITDDVVEMPKLRRSQSMSTNTPPMMFKGADAENVGIQPTTKEADTIAVIEPSSTIHVGHIQLGAPVKPPRKKTSRSTSPASQYDAQQSSGPTSNTGEKKRDAGGPNEIVACTTCGGNSGSPCTHSANNGCATETCFVQVRKKEPPHPIRIAKTIDVIARITFPTAYAIFLIFFFVHYKGFS